MKIYKATQFALTVLIIFLFWVSKVKAQDTKTNQIGLFGCISIPTGDFGGDRAREVNDQLKMDGFAKMGFGIGAKYIIPIDHSGLGIIISPSLIINGVDGNELEKEIGDDDYDYNVDPGRWMNIPIMGGINYQNESSPSLNYSVFAMAGLNMVYGPSIDIDYSSDYYEGTIKIDIGSGNTIGFCVGGELEMNEQYFIGLRIYSLGEPELDVDFEDNYRDEYGDHGTDTDYSEMDFSISFLLFTVGINL